MEGVVKEVNQCLYTAIAEAIARCSKKKKLSQATTTASMEDLA